MADAASGRGAAGGQDIVWLASFPKSGNTWTRVLLSNLVAQGSIDGDRFTSLAGANAASRAAFDFFCGLPSSDLTDDEIDLLRPAFYRAQAHDALVRLFVKGHDGYHDCGNGEPLFPADCSAGAIYLVRHPFDVAVSFASHQGHADYERVVRQMNDPGHAMFGGSKTQLRQRTLGWRGHYLSWHRQDAIPVLTLRYEDMLADTAGALSRMATFLGLPQAADDALIAAAVEASRFERLRAREDEHGFHERPENAARFFRAGRAGDGWDLLSKGQRQALLDVNGDVMEELGYRA